MRDEQQRSSQTHDGYGRRKDAPPARRFARRLDCGGDGRTSDLVVRRSAWPAARALGTPREGAGADDETGPGAA